MGLHEEIFEQPSVLRGILDHQWPHVEAIAASVDLDAIDYVYVVARGSSDNAGLYAKYLLGIVNGMPVAMALPSLFTMYHAPPRLGRALVLGISQSGRSPDIVQAVTEGRRQGAATIVITNSPDSPLAQASEHVIDIRAGDERAVAATKTYTAQLLAVAMLSTALARSAERREALEAVPELVSRALETDESLAGSAQRFRYMEQCVVLGRGYNYATAYEWSLKLKELTYVVAEPYSSADFRHGPIAIVERGFPVLAVVAEGAVSGDLLALVARLQDEREAELVVVSDMDEALAFGRTACRLPKAPEWISPMTAIVPGQLFSYHLTLAKGFDPEHPRGLRKVTSTE